MILHKVDVNNIISSRQILKSVIENAIADCVYLSVYKCIHIIKISPLQRDPTVNSYPL